MMRVRPSPRERIIELLKKEPGLTRSEVATRLGVTYWSSRYWLEKIVAEKFLRKEVELTIRGFVRRIRYYPVVAVIYYRTQLAIMFYASAPRTKTPDPIAEFRVTAVSNIPNKYNLQEFERACVYIGVILAPQTYWLKQEMIVTADEKDEVIDVDELQYSVPAFKRLNYAERYGVFFRSRRGKDLWREAHPYWWLDPTKPLPAPETGDYEYGERYIKDLEEKKIMLGVLKVRFDNERGEVESVEI
jgi:hypothetical protein